MSKARNVILWTTIAALSLLPTQEADAWSAMRRRHNHNQEMRAKREATEKAIAESLAKDTVSFEKEYLKQQLDTNLESYFRKEGVKKLIAFYWNDTYKSKLSEMIDTISSDPKKYCNFTKDVKLHNIWFREYEWEVINDTIRLSLNEQMIDILLKQTYNEYFTEMNNKVNTKLKSILDSKDTESLEFYYGKETISSSLQNMMEEIVNNPEKYWKLENWEFSFADKDWKLLHEEELKKLWEEYFDDSKAAFSENFLKLMACIAVFIIGWVFILWIKER